MKTIILAGGFGTRISEKTTDIPKPMIEIGGKPILLHIMNHYAAYGFKEFIIALGYKGDVIKQFFFNFYTMNNDFTVDLAKGDITIHKKNTLSWKVHLVDTGLETMTGGRLKRLQEWVGKEPFLMTYGDGLSDVNIKELVSFHQSHGKKATVLSVRPPARFGSLQFDGNRIAAFKEKPQAEEGWINGGFFVLENSVFNYLTDDHTVWELDPLEKLAKEKELMGFHHAGFWQPMDTLRDWKQLQALWDSGHAPWVIK